MIVILNNFLVEVTEKFLFRDKYCYHDIMLHIAWYKILVILPTTIPTLTSFTDFLNIFLDIAYCCFRFVALVTTQLD